MFAACLAMLCTIAVGNPVLSELRRRKLGKGHDEDAPEEYASKVGTPVMGGVIFLTGIVIATLVFAVPRDRETLVPLLAMLAAATLGMFDDFRTLVGRDAIEAFLTRKWAKELDYRLIKEVWAFRDNRIAVRFAYEWHDDSGNWYRSYGNENWEFDEHGLMRLRIASINDLGIKDSERKYHWPLGRRPDDHPSLSDLAL